KLAKRVPEEIAKAFNRSELKAVLDYSFERSPDDVRTYLEENFKLAATDHLAHPGTQGAPSPVATNTPDVDRHNSESNELTTLIVDIAETASSDGGTSLEGSVEIASATGNEENAGGLAADLHRPSSRPSKPPIIERFAAAQGFQRDGDRRFFHPDGSWIAKTL